MTRELLNLLHILKMVHQLAIEQPDRPVTAEMDLRAFNNPSDAVHDRSGGFTSAVESATGWERIRRLWPG